jgi:adenylate cyclase
VVLDGVTLLYTSRIPRRYWRGGALSLVGVAIIVATIFLVQHLTLKPPRSHASIPPEAQPALPLPEKPSIAVLPFTNLSGDPKQDYFSDGITDDLTTALSEFPDLFVIASSSSFTYKGRVGKAQDVGHELGVRYLLEGSVRKKANQLRITTQLVDATTGGNLWAQRFDRPLGDIFSLQDEIVRNIAATLKLQIGLLQQDIEVRQGTRNLEAYDDFLRAITYSWIMTKDTNAKAQHFLEEAIKLDPQYADAYALLGIVNFLAVAWQWVKAPDGINRSIELEQKAIALDDFQPMAHAMLGRLLVFRRQYDQALAECDRSLGLAANLAYDYLWIAETLDLAGEPAEAIKLAEKAMRLDPAKRDFYLAEVGLGYFLMRRDKEAVSAFEQHLSAFPNNVGARLGLAASYAELGMVEQARSQASAVMRISPLFSIEALKPTVPLKDQAQTERLANALFKAGLK